MYVCVCVCLCVFQGDCMCVDSLNNIDALLMFMTTTLSKADTQSVGECHC